MQKIRYNIPLNFDEEIPTTIQSNFKLKKRLKRKKITDDYFMDDYVMDDFNQNDYSEFFGTKSNRCKDDDLYDVFEENTYSPR